MPKVVECSSELIGISLSHLFPAPNALACEAPGSGEQSGPNPPPVEDPDVFCWERAKAKRVTLKDIV